MRIGGCKNGHQIRSYINNGQRFNEFLYNKGKKNKLNINGNPGAYFNASSKYQKYVNDESPPCPNKETLRYTDFYFPTSRQIFDMPLWDGLTTRIKDDSCIHKIGKNIGDLEVYRELLEKNNRGSNHIIDTNDFSRKFFWITNIGIHNELTAFVLILLKTELDNNSNIRDMILDKLYKHILAYFAVNEISNEFMFLFLMINKRFTSYWRNITANENLFISKIPKGFEMKIFRMNKIFQLIFDLSNNDIVELDKKGKIRVISSYLKNHSSIIKRHINLFYSNRELLKVELENYINSGQNSFL